MAGNGARTDCGTVLSGFSDDVMHGFDWIVSCGTVLSPVAGFSRCAAGMRWPVRARAVGVTQKWLAFDVLPRRHISGAAESRTASGQAG